jgi:hypothetical protein
MEIISKLKAKTYQLTDIIKYKKTGHPPRVSIGKNNNKKCLLIYLSSPLTWKQNDPRLDWHENFRQSKQIAETLAFNGYQTDIIDMYDSLFVPEKEYKLFIGHGPNAIRILEYLKPTCKKICLTTGQYGPYANQQVQQRYNDLSLRKNKNYQPVYPSSLKKEDYEIFDEIVCFGNEINIETFKPLDMPVYGFPNYANPNISFIESSQKNSKHFIYIAASRHILKGLDLLLEIFSANPSWHLHIFGKLDSEIKDNFQEYLACRNIHQHGYVKMGSRTFTHICKKSMFYISPTCSDSMQGTTLNAMAAGVIPVITRDTGVKLFGCGYYIKDVSIPALTKQIEKCTKIDDITHKKLSHLALEVVNQHYRPKNFLDAWNKIIE